MCMAFLFIAVFRVSASPRENCFLILMRAILFHMNNRNAILTNNPMAEVVHE